MEDLSFLFDVGIFVLIFLGVIWFMNWLDGQNQLRIKKLLSEFGLDPEDPDLSQLSDAELINLQSRMWDWDWLEKIYDEVLSR